jgi:hypothetical protein
MIKNCCYISRGLKHAGAKYNDKAQIVISGAFNNKSVHFVGVIIV